MVVYQPSSTSVVLSDAEVVNKTRHNFKSKIGNEYSAKDVIKVWDCISKWIENKLNQDKGILIKGIGYFTLAQWTLNVGKGYPYILRKPVFVIDEKLAKDYNLKRRRPHNTANIRERYLNLLSVAQDFELNSVMVIHCFKEVVAAFRKLLYEERNCELPFPKIGKLQIKNKAVTMRFYQEFLERQNQHLKDMTDGEKKRVQTSSYNPDWNADQYENQKRPCTAMSIINRPASSLSQYRPGTGYQSVLPDCATTRPKSRPGSRLSVQSRPGSSQSVCSRPGSSQSVCSRPGSSQSVCSRPGSSQSVCSRPSSRLSVQSRPGSSQSVCSRLSIQSRPGSSQSVCSRPGSRLSVPGPSQPVCPRPSSSQSKQSRPSSRSQSGGRARLQSRLSVSAAPDECTRPGSRSQGGRETGSMSRISDHRLLNDRNGSTSRPLTAQSTAPCTARPATKCEPTSGDSPTTAVIENARPCSKRSTSKTADDGPQNRGGVCEKPIESDYDETLCCLCNLRNIRFGRLDACKAKGSSADNKDNFMTGDSLLNRLRNAEMDDKRKNRIKEISNYNYVTANELSDAVYNEKTKRRNERNVENDILSKRPVSICNSSEKRKNLKNALLNQIERKKIKTETDKIASLKTEKQMQDELLKSLHDERMKNIEAKNRSKENYLILLDEHMKNKIQIDEQMKKKYNDTNMMPNSILGTNAVQSQSCPKLNKHKNRELANYQLEQLTARNLASRHQKEKLVDFEREMLNKIKEEDEKLRCKLLQKKLNQNKFLSEELNKLLVMAETERRQNAIPSGYTMSFPLKKMGKRCRICKKNGLGFPRDKITDLPC